MQKNIVPAFAAATGTTQNNPQGLDTPAVDPFLRRPDVCQITTLPSSSLTDLIARGDFPKPYKLSKRMSAWRTSEVVEWMESRKHAGEV